MAPPFSKPFLEGTLKRVRVFFNRQFILDTKQAKLVWFKPYYPLYCFKQEDLPNKFLSKSPTAQSSDDRSVYDLVLGDKKVEGAVTKYTKGELEGLLNIRWDAADAWFEEDEQIYVHPKDPYKRVDVLQSSRHVQIKLNGVELANTTKPRLLFETSLHVRTYIPLTDCRLDLLSHSDLTTECPYKGVSNYYNVTLPNGEKHENIVWYYRTPQLECAEIKGFLAFYDEKVEVYFDGVKQA